MDNNSKQQEYIQPFSYDLGVARFSPLLSPMIAVQNLRTPQLIDQDLLNFHLGDSEIHHYTHLSNLNHILIRQPPVLVKSVGQQDQKNHTIQIEENMKEKTQNRSLQDGVQEGEQQEDMISKQQYVYQCQTSPLMEMIVLLINNVTIADDQLVKRIKKVVKKSQRLMLVYEIIIKKFKKLKKTKEQMIKYCMRKAFKFISDQRKNRKEKNIDSDLQSPFNSCLKKIGTQKTMNENFLRKVFTEQGFLQDYHKFLQNFKQMMEEDNRKKIRYLGSIIQQFLDENNFRKIQSIKRIPWTKQILAKTLDLSYQLPMYADPNYFTVSKKSKL